MTHTIDFRSGFIGPLMIGLMSLLGCAAVFGAGVSLWFQLFLMPVALLLAAYSCSRWPIHRRWKRIVTRLDGFLQLIDADGRKRIVEPTGQAFLSPVFVAFAVREADGRVIWIAGFYDQFEVNQYRLLLSWMRFSF